MNHVNLKSIQCASQARLDRNDQKKPCNHLDQIQEVQAASDGCEECLQMGDRWVHLRMFLICGHIGCCGSTKHDHALQHYQETSHPLIKPFKQGGMDWIWCYEDTALLTDD